MIYFDNSATTKMFPEAVQSYQTVSEQYFGNPSSLHELGDVSSKLLKQARASIAQQLGVHVEEIFFTSGGTEGDNWMIKGTAFKKQYYGKHIITTRIEHSAVNHAMDFLEGLGFEITYLPVNKAGQVDLVELREALRSDTILVSIIALNNEVGVIQNLEAIGEILREYPTVHFHIDAVQTVGKMDLKLGPESRIDMAVFSSHKFHGPRGCGFVYLKRGKDVTPLIHGGGQEMNQRSGTENLPAIVAMAKAFRLVKESEQATQHQLKQLTDRLKQGLHQYKQITVFTPEEASAVHIVCFGIKGVRGEVVVHALEEHDIYVSTTSACSSKSGGTSGTLSAMGFAPQVAETAVRISLTGSNTMAEVEQFLDVLDELYQNFDVIHSK